VTGTGPAIAVRGLVKRYDGRAVVDGLDLTVERGEIVAMLGPNGAGKTTTVEIIEGYRRADEESSTQADRHAVGQGRGRAQRGDPYNQVLRARGGPPLRRLLRRARCRRA
jgi:ABC-2 type transport system ATP-binding protein